MPTERKEYYSYDDLIKDMELTIKGLETAVDGINGLNKAGWMIINTTDFENFARECSRIITVLHFNIQTAKRLKEENGELYGVCPF